MAKRNKNQRKGCVGLLPLTALAFGALACAYSFYLGRTQGGQEVSMTTGLTFYLGWVCGMGLTIMGVILAILQSILTRAGDLAGKVTGDKGDGPGGLGILGGIGGGLAGLGFLEEIMKRNK